MRAFVRRCWLSKDALDHPTGYVGHKAPASIVLQKATICRDFQGKTPQACLVVPSYPVDERGEGSTGPGVVWTAAETRRKVAMGAEPESLRSVPTEASELCPKDCLSLTDTLCAMAAPLNRV